MKMKKGKKKGFTLIELMVVLAILGILAAIAIPKYNEVKYRAAVEADIRSAEAIIHAARMEILLDEKLGGVNIGDKTEDVADQLPYLDTKSPDVQSNPGQKFELTYVKDTNILSVKFKPSKACTAGGVTVDTGKQVKVTEGGTVTAE